MSVAAYLRQHQGLLILPIVLTMYLIERHSWRQLKRDLAWNRDKIDNRLSNLLIVLGFGLSFYLRISTDHDPLIRFIKPPEGQEVTFYSILSWVFVILGCFLHIWGE